MNQNLIKKGVSFEIKFAEMLFNIKIKSIDDVPIFEHPLNESKESFCNFLNKREGEL